MVGLPCGLIATEAYGSTDYEVTVIENKNGKDLMNERYSWKSYIYSIADVDSGVGKLKKKYGLISIINVDKGCLFENHIILSKRMGEGLGRQFGRVIERQKAKAHLINVNNELKAKTNELENTLANIETLLVERFKRIETQTFLFGTINHDFKRSLIAI